MYCASSAQIRPPLTSPHMGGVPFSLIPCAPLGAPGIHRLGPLWPKMAKNHPKRGHPPFWPLFQEGSRNSDPIFADFRKKKCGTPPPPLAGPSFGGVRTFFRKSAKTRFGFLLPLQNRVLDGGGGLYNPRSSVPPHVLLPLQPHCRLRYSGRAIPLGNPGGGAIPICPSGDSAQRSPFLGQNAIFRQKKTKIFSAQKLSKNGPKVVKNGPQIGEINRGGPPENPNESQKYRKNSQKRSHSAI